MADFRVPVWQTSIVVEGMRYAANANGIITVPEDLADEVARLGGIRDGGGFSVATWADAEGSAVVSPGGDVVGLGGGGGATMFTSLTYNADTMVLTLADEEAESSVNGQASFQVLTKDVAQHPFAKGYAGVETFWQGFSGVFSGQMYAGVTDASGVNGVITFSVNGNSAAAAADMEVEMRKELSAQPFKMTNFDVVASDAAARLTVGGTEYSVAKAIKVKIGTDTYYWPLFGPV